MSVHFARIFLALIGLFLIGALALLPKSFVAKAPAANSYVVESATNTHEVIWGAYVGDSVEDGDAFENLVGQRMKTRATFVHWGNNREFPIDIAEDVRKKGQILTMFWEAMDYSVATTTQPRFSYKAILNGDWDSYISSFASSTKNYGGPIILIPFEEMNGDWYPWSGTENGNSAHDGIAAYRYIRAFFADVPNVKFGWDVNSDSVPDTEENKLEGYYPGDDAVDFVGVDGFNDGNPWLSFDEIFSLPLTRLEMYHKPIFIFSFAAAEDSQKAKWISDAMNSISNNPNIAGWIWFNENKEKDWRINSSSSSLSAFQQVLP